MNQNEFRKYLEKHGLRQSDLAWIAGVNVRHARAWALAEYPVPRYVSLLLKALEQKKIDINWISNTAGEAPPEGLNYV